MCGFCRCLTCCSTYRSLVHALGCVSGMLPCAAFILHVARLQAVLCVLQYFVIQACAN